MATPSNPFLDVICIMTNVSALTIYLLCHFVFLFFTQITGDGGGKVAGNKTVYCRNADSCPTAAVYAGPDCPCRDQVCCLEPGSIATKKCVEYGEYVYSEEYEAGLMMKAKVARVSQCRIEAVPLVVGGVKAADMEFPHMVAIGFGDGDKKKYMCGGTLISEQHVLTAAHCNTSRDLGAARWAKLGALSLSDPDDGEAVQEIPIAQRILHPRFKPPSKYDDIAVFKLAHPVRVSGYARPACLSVDPPTQVNNVTATGWGKLTASASDMSQFLMKVYLSVIPADICRETYSLDEGGLTLPNGTISSQMCAGDLKGGKDTCQGDSGGPLQVTLATPHCMFNVIAVTSFGKSCALPRSPAIYTQVHHYIPWIESVVWPQ